MNDMVLDYGQQGDELERERRTLEVLNKIVFSLGFAQGAMEFLHEDDSLSRLPSIEEIMFLAARLGVADQFNRSQS